MLAFRFSSVQIRSVFAIELCEMRMFSSILPHTKKDEIRLATLVENGCAFEFFFLRWQTIFFCRVATVQQQHSSQIPNSPSNSNERNKKITDRELKERRTNFLPRTCVSKRTKQQKRPKRYEFQFLTEETLKVYWIVKPMNVIILSVCVVAERPLLLLILPRVLCDTQAMCIYSISVCDTFNSARECCAERRGTCNTGAATHSTTHSTVWFAGFVSVLIFVCLALSFVNCKLPNGNFCTIHIHHIAIASRCSVSLSFILSLGTHITISHYAPHNCRARIRMKMDLSLIHIFTPSNHKKCVTQMSFSVACCIPWCHVLHWPFFFYDCIACFEGAMQNDSHRTPKYDECLAHDHNINQLHMLLDIHSSYGRNCLCAYHISFNQRWVKRARSLALTESERDKEKRNMQLSGSQLWFNVYFKCWLSLASKHNMICNVHNTLEKISSWVKTRNIAISMHTALVFKIFLGLS